jgi:hypothetical protein
MLGKINKKEPSMKWKLKVSLKLLVRNIVPEREILFESDSLKKDNCIITILRLTKWGGGGAVRRF